MNLKLETEFSKAPILKEVDALKKQIDDMRPLGEDIEGRVMQKLRLDWNYHSNAIEGNRLSYGETVAFLMEGITAKGKPLKDHLDIRGHNEAINFLLSFVKDLRPMSEADIRALHKMILVEPYQVDAQTANGLPTTKVIKLGEYKTMSNHVQTATGEIHYYSTPEEVPIKMQKLIEWYRQANNNDNIHPLVVASLFHHKFVSIHPFDDGNGRLSRILMNLILMQKNFPPIVVKTDDRKNYYSLLSRADSGESWPFIEYMAEREQGSLQLFLKAINGGDIDEDEDIDKEIALLKMRLSGGVVAKEKKSKAAIEKVFFDSVFPLAGKLADKAKNFNEYFFAYTSQIGFNYLESRQRYVANLDISEANTEKYRSFFSDKNKADFRFYINLTYKEYKDPHNNFNISIEISVTFEELYYKVYDMDKLLLSKLYHEKITKDDQSKIIRHFLDNFTTQLNEKVKSPPSN